MIKRITQLEKQKEIIGYLLPELSQISDKNKRYDVDPASLSFASDLLQNTTVNQTEVPLLKDQWFKRLPVFKCELKADRDIDIYIDHPLVRF